MLLAAWSPRELPDFSSLLLWFLSKSGEIVALLQLRWNRLWTDCRGSHAIKVLRVWWPMVFSMMTVKVAREDFFATVHLLLETYACTSCIIIFRSDTEQLIFWLFIHLCKREDCSHRLAVVSVCFSSSVSAHVVYQCWCHPGPLGRTGLVSIVNGGSKSCVPFKLSLFTWALNRQGNTSPH